MNMRPEVIDGLSKKLEDVLLAKNQTLKQLSDQANQLKEVFFKKISLSLSLSFAITCVLLCSLKNNKKKKSVTMNRFIIMNQPCEIMTFRFPNLVSLLPFCEEEETRKKIFLVGGATHTPRSKKLVFKKKNHKIKKKNLPRKEEKILFLFLVFFFLWLVFFFCSWPVS